MDTITKTELLGEGQFGIAYKYVDKPNNQVSQDVIKAIETSETQAVPSGSPSQYVVKSMNQKTLKKLDDKTKKFYIENAKKEAEILEHLSKDPVHEAILKYVGCSKDPINTNEVFIITEFNDGYIELTKFIFNPDSAVVIPFPKRTFPYLRPPEPVVNDFIKRCISQLYSGLHAIHAKTVVHRDIKPDNILIHPKTGDIKYIDFGLADKFPNLYDAPRGSPEYVSPLGWIGGVQRNEMQTYYKILQHCDYFALALIIYTLFCIRDDILNDGIKLDLKIDYRQMLYDKSENYRNIYKFTSFIYESCKPRSNNLRELRELQSIDKSISVKIRGGLLYRIQDIDSILNALKATNKDDHIYNIYPVLRGYHVFST
jgi:serine/threonine protein kinase